MSLAGAGKQLWWSSDADRVRKTTKWTDQQWQKSGGPNALFVKPDGC